MLISEHLWDMPHNPLNILSSLHMGLFNYLLEVLDQDILNVLVSLKGFLPLILYSKDSIWSSYARLLTVGQRILCFSPPS